MPLIREQHDFYLYYLHHKTCESSFADIPFTVVFNPVNNIDTGIVPKIISPRDIFSRIQDVFVRFLNKLQEAIEFLEQLIFVSSAVDELRSKQRFSKLLKWIKLKDLINDTTGY